MDEYLGIIKIFGGNFAPRGWAMCQGQNIAISANTALFSILGTTYGGNGQSTFALPDLRGRAPIGYGQGPGLTNNYVLGQKAGVEAVTLTIMQMPIHNHVATFTPGGGGGGGGVKASSAPGAVPAPSATNPTLAAATDPDGNVTINLYNASAPDITLNTGGGGSGGGTVTVGNSGGSQPFSILQPILAVNYIICTEGLFPTRN